ncbi:MAG: ATP phosphoribosyltransferase regulatory subunit [Clostridium sp.]|nr:ATP phosphoribosyltransferase regulatory subunit [Clostridium sp.]MCM1547116.1 ATP phosphoribosyltransferase regulatory subunit [Ruminococcus sp.]
MKRNDLITPEGTKDLLFDECIIRKSVEDKVHAIFKSRGYSELITPSIEFYDVFDHNSGYFMQEKLFKLTDLKGRLMVLRPDNTVPIARIVATRLKEAVLPMRLYYNQCVFTMEPFLKGRSAQTVQTGVELVGSSSKMAELEVISTAIEVLSSCSEGEFSLEIGDVRFFRELVDRLEATDAQKEEIRDLVEAKNYPVLNDLLDGIGKNGITRALKMLPRLFGGVEVFEKASSLFSDEKVDKALSDLKDLYNKISAIIGVGRLTVDLGMVNRTDYYTGVIIKGYLEGYGEEVLSGGRYDKLISDFGYDVPAIGFAVNVDAVTQVELKHNPVKAEPVDVIVFAEKGFETKALEKAGELRKSGIKAEISLFETIDETVKYAARKNISEVITVDEKEGE